MTPDSKARDNEQPGAKRQEATPMTAEERAQQLVIDLYGIPTEPWDERELSIIQDFLKTAEDIAYAEGFKAAREKAAQIADVVGNRWESAAKEISDKIHSLSPERGKSK